MIEHPIPTTREIKEAMHVLDMLIVAAEDGRTPLPPIEIDSFVAKLARAYSALDEFTRHGR